MRFNGKWLECEDGVHRPVLDGAVIDPGGAAMTFPFLIDTGADSTVLSYEAVAYVGLEVEIEGGAALEGIGGLVRSVAVATQFWLLNSAGTPIRFPGRFSGRPFPTGDQMCILGRDLLGHFAVIIDRPAGAICLIQGSHRYIIQES